MNIEYVHASKFGNGASVAAEFRKQMASNGVVVEVHHIRQVTPTELSPADLYVFGSPGRIGKPIRSMRRFLKKVDLPAGTRYAILTTEVAPKPDKKTGQMPTEAELAKYHRVRGRGQGPREGAQRPAGGRLGEQGAGLRGGGPGRPRRATTGRHRSIGAAAGAR